MSTNPDGAANKGIYTLLQKNMLTNTAVAVVATALMVYEPEIIFNAIPEEFGGARYLGAVFGTALTGLGVAGIIMAMNAHAEARAEQMGDEAETAYRRRTGRKLRR